MLEDGSLSVVSMKFPTSIRQFATIRISGISQDSLLWLYKL